MLQCCELIGNTFTINFIIVSNYYDDVVNISTDIAL